MTKSEIERLLFQGTKVEVSGTLHKIQIGDRSGNLTNKLDYYLEANYIQPCEESFLTLKWTSADIEDFQKLALRPDWLKAIRQSVFYDIHGYHEECEGVVLQMFGGVDKDRRGANIRGSIHILLVGDAGTAKTTILKIAMRFNPKSMYAAGTGISGVGLTVSVVKDELLGGLTSDVGLLVLCNGGVAMIDELDKIPPDFKDALHEPLADQTCSIHKASVHATFNAKTSVLAAANPKNSSYSEFDTVYSQIDLSSTLINRFDLVYPIRESVLTTEDDEAIAYKILTRDSLDENKCTEYAWDFLRKYVAYAKTINPATPEKIAVLAKKRYAELKNVKRRIEAEGKAGTPITGRTVSAIQRLAQAVARSRLHAEITPEDFEIAFRKVLYSTRQLGVDPDSGDVVEEVAFGSLRKRKDVYARIMVLVRDKNKKDHEPMDVDELISILAAEGFVDEFKIGEYVNKLCYEGDLIETRPGKYTAR